MKSIIFNAKLITEIIKMENGKLEIMYIFKDSTGNEVYFLFVYSETYWNDCVSINNTCLGEFGWPAQ